MGEELRYKTTTQFLLMFFLALATFLGHSMANRALSDARPYQIFA
jgi:hypothetical protein